MVPFSDLLVYMLFQDTRKVVAFGGSKPVPDGDRWETGRRTPRRSHLQGRHFPSTVDEIFSY